MNIEIPYPFDESVDAGKITLTHMLNDGSAVDILWNKVFHDEEYWAAFTTDGLSYFAFSIEPSEDMSPEDYMADKGETEPTATETDSSSMVCITGIILLLLILFILILILRKKKEEDEEEQLS